MLYFSSLSWRTYPGPSDLQNQGTESDGSKRRPTPPYLRDFFMIDDDAKHPSVFKRKVDNIFSVSSKRIAEKRFKALSSAVIEIHKDRMIDWVELMSATARLEDAEWGSVFSDALSLLKYLLQAIARMTLPLHSRALKNKCKKLV
jgi:hypothetical protein